MASDAKELQRVINDVLKSKEAEILGVLINGRSRALRFQHPRGDRLEAWSWHIFVTAFSLSPIAVCLAAFGGRLFPVVLLLCVQLLGIVGLVLNLGADFLRLFAWRRAEVHWILAGRAMVVGRARDLQRRFPGFQDWRPLCQALRSWRDSRGYRLGYILALVGVLLSLYLAQAAVPTLGCPASGPMQALSNFFGSGEACAWQGFGLAFMLSGLLGSLVAYAQWRRASTMVDVLEWLQAEPAEEEVLRV